MQMKRITAQREADEKAVLPATSTRSSLLGLLILCLNLDTEGIR